MKIFFFNELYLWLYLAFIFEGKFRILCQLNEVLVAVVVILLNNLKSFRKETFFQFFQTIWMEWCHWIQLSLYESLFFFLEGWGGSGFFFMRKSDFWCQLFAMVSVIRSPQSNCYLWSVQPRKSPTKAGLLNCTVFRY